MLSCQLVLHAPSFMPFSVSFPFNAYFHGPHVDWAVPSLVTMFHLQNTFIEAIPNWSHGYQAARSSRSQELPEASPPHPPQATSATSPTTTETLTPEELELSRQHRATTRASSSSTSLTVRSTPWMPDWRHWNPRLTTNHSYFGDYQLQDLQWTTSTGISFYMKNKDPE